MKVLTLVTYRILLDIIESLSALLFNIRYVFIKYLSHNMRTDWLATIVYTDQRTETRLI